MKLFICHSSNNNASALALEQWLKDNGWEGSYFLDISNSKGLKAGEDWQNRLTQACNICEAVICLISKDWQDSKWCFSEFRHAKGLGKKIFGVLIEDIPVESLDVELTASTQLCDLANGEEKTLYTVQREPIVAQASVEFSSAGLRDLLHGLQNAGIGADSFPWPPKGEPDRAPYRGLEPLKAEDAAVFFGREADIIRCMDEIRKMQDGGQRNTLVILGASGSGKSSFMRAGLWPRLNRERQRFITMPAVRPARDVFDAEEGLVSSLNKLCTLVKLNKNLGEIKACVRDPEQLTNLLLDIASRWSVGEAPGTQRHLTFILPIDQAEELYTSNGNNNATQFLDVVSTLLQRKSLADDAMLTLDLMLILTIRSDMYEYLQRDPHFESGQQHFEGLTALDATQYKSVIKGPAARVTQAGHPLEVTPDLTRQLLLDTRGADALPLLAFTLERLYRDYGSDGDLRFDEYEQMGFIEGSIMAAIDKALDNPTRSPMIPQDPEAQMALLREAFIPALAAIDQESNEPKRRIGEWASLPHASRPLLERLVAAHLLVRDEATLDTASLAAAPDNNENFTTLEIAHEALLRHWPQLKQWLREEQEDLTTLEVVLADSARWEAAPADSKGDFLLHKRERLQLAEVLLRRAEFARQLGDVGERYLRACRKLEEKVVRERREQQEREKKQIEEKANQQRRTARQQKWVTILMVGLGILILGFAYSTYQQRSATMLLQVRLAAILYSVAGTALDQGNSPDAAAMLAQSVRLQSNNEAARGKLMHILGAEAWQLLLAEIEFEAEATVIAFSADGHWLATGAADGKIMLWDVSRGTMELHETLDHGSTILVAGFTPDSKRLVFGGGQGMIRIHDLASGPVADLPHEVMSNVRSLLIAESGEWIATGTSFGTLGLWRQSDESEFDYQQFFSEEAENLPNARTRSLQVSSNEKYLMSRSFNDLRIWDINTGSLISTPIESREAIVFAEFLNDEPVVLITYEIGSSKIFHAQENRLRNTDAKGGLDYYRFEDGSIRIISADVETSAVLVEINTTTLDTRRIESATFDHLDAIQSAKFSDDGMLIATSARDNSVKLWTNNGEPLSAPLVHATRPGRPVFSPDGSLVATTAGTKVSLWSTTKLPSSGKLSISTRIPISRTGFEVNFSPNGKWVGAAGTARAEVYDSASGTLKQAWTVDEGLFDPTPADRQQASISFSQDSEQVLVTTLGNTATLGSVETGESTSLVHPDGVRAALFSPDGSYIVTVSNNGFGYIWPSEIHADGRIHEIDSAIALEAGSAVFDVAISSNSNAIIAGSFDGSVHSWNSSGRLLWSKQAHTGPVDRISVANNIAISGSRDNSAIIWDATTGEELQALEEPAAAFFVDTSSDDSLAITASTTEARIWDTDSGQLAGDPLSHDNPLAFGRAYRNAVMVAKFSPLGGRVATGARDGDVRLWDVQTHSLLSDPLRHGNEVLDLAFDSTGDRIAVASRDRKITIWNVPVGKSEDSSMIASVAEAIVGLSMSTDNSISITQDRVEKIRDLNALLDCTIANSLECSLKKIVDKVGEK